jgi:glycosyltransferase involved in cell wall biosynthesis
MNPRGLYLPDDVRRKRNAETMPIVSIITAVSNSSLPYLDEAWESVQRLRLPRGWHFEWCLQQDGDGPEVYRDWFSDARVSYGYNGRWLMAGMTRNMALMRASGEYIFSYDADDLLCAEALRILIRRFTEHSEIVWCAGRWDELFIDGTTRVRPVDANFEGKRNRGWVSSYIEKVGKTPFPMSPTMYRTRAVFQVGGWPGYAEYEDTILLVSISRRHPGWVTNELIGLYRRHPTQTTKTDWFQDKDRTDKIYAFIKRLGSSEKIAH